MFKCLVPEVILTIYNIMPHHILESCNSESKRATTIGPPPLLRPSLEGVLGEVCNVNSPRAASS